MPRDIPPTTPPVLLFDVGASARASHRTWDVICVEWGAVHFDIERIPPFRDISSAAETVNYESHVMIVDEWLVVSLLNI